MIVFTKSFFSRQYMVYINGDCIIHNFVKNNEKMIILKKPNILLNNANYIL